MSAADENDALSALAPLLRVRPELQMLCRFGDQWASPHDHEAEGWAPFHMVTVGTCVIDLVDHASVTLEAGDIVLLPHGDAHTVRGQSTAQGARPQMTTTVTTTDVVMIRSNTETPEAELICGRLAFEQAQASLARAALPRFIHIKTGDAAALSRLGGLLLAIREELEGAAPGARAIARDLASALFVMVLRTHFETHPAKGLLALLRERHTARAVTALMREPARPWSLDEIAKSANTSRATLVREFRRLAGAAPFDVLAEIRLGLARQSLCATNRPLADIAIESGYQSQSAFSRAFQKRFQVSPGALRQRQL